QPQRDPNTRASQHEGVPAPRHQSAKASQHKGTQHSAKGAQHTSLGQRPRSTTPGKSQGLKARNIDNPCRNHSPSSSFTSSSAPRTVNRLSTNRYAPVSTLTSPESAAPPAANAIAWAASPITCTLRFACRAISLPQSSSKSSKPPPPDGSNHTPPCIQPSHGNA